MGRVEGRVRLRHECSVRRCRDGLGAIEGHWWAGVWVFGGLVCSSSIPTRRGARSGWKTSPFVFRFISYLVFFG